MNLQQLKIGNKTTKLPIIQGGMGIGVSLSSLASAVANAGGIGIISGVQIGFREADFDRNTQAANLRALVKEIRRAKELSPDGIIGVNLMVAIKNYADMVRVCVEEKVDLIISGAGLPKDLPELVKGSQTKIAPIVSSAKAAVLLTKLWLRRYNYQPDLLIVEGPLAGGHLGYSFDELEDVDKHKLEDIVKEVIQAIEPFEEITGIKIPLIAAGGIYDGEDISRFLKLGASGVQMGTRFVATHECDASEEFKENYVRAKREDIDFILSPVGMPGQALINPFIKRVKAEKEKITKCYSCLTPCSPARAPYCISTALINAVTGRADDGLVFIGKSGHKIEKIVSVDELMKELAAGIH